MPRASSCSPTKISPSLSRRSSSAASSVSARSTVSMCGLSLRAISTICRLAMVSGTVTTSIAALVMWACTSTMGSEASPLTAGLPARRTASTTSRLLSATM